MREKGLASFPVTYRHVLERLPVAGRRHYPCRIDDGQHILPGYPPLLIEAPYSPAIPCYSSEIHGPILPQQGEYEKRQDKPA